MHSLKIVDACTSFAASDLGACSRSSTREAAPNIAAATAKTTSVPLTARSTPASAGPRKKARLSTVLETAFVAVSSLGVAASVGMIACWADLYGALAIEVTMANA
jgi:hypothetical protein